MPAATNPAEGDAAVAQQVQARHRNLLGYGERAVRRAADAHVAVVGAGGLGCPALLSLAASGVGRITIIDDDVVEPSNLARQTLYRREDIGRAKVEAATDALAGMGARIATHRIRLTDHNARALLAGADVVLDTTDQWPTRFAIADAARHLGIPLVWGSVLGWDGLLTVFTAGGAQLDDLVDRKALLHATDTPNCASAGVFSPLTAEIGGAMAGEALRLMTDSGPSLSGIVRSWDAKRGRVREIPLAATRETDPQHVPQPADARPAQAAHAAPQQQRPTVTLADDAFILDVRPAAHPDLTLNRPYAHIALEHLESALISGALVLPNAPIAVVCALGPRARAAAALLRDAGYDRVTALDGGVRALDSVAR